jgi:hypothetical protein
MGSWLLDPNDFVIALAGGDISTPQLVASLLASNVAISSDNGSAGTMGNIYVNDAVSWAGASTLTLNAVHDVLVNAPVTGNTAGSKFVVVAGNDISTTMPLTVVAAGSTISLTAAHDIHSGGTLNAVAAGSNIVLNAGNDVFSAGAVTATAGNSNVLMTAGRDVNVSAAMIAVAAASTIRLTAGRDINTNTTAAIAGSAATTQLEFMAGHDINIKSAVAAGAAGSGVKMYSGLSGTGPGVASGTVRLSAAVAAPTISIRFNPDGYINTPTAIAQFTAGADARAWVYLQANNKVYDSTTSATISMQGTPADGGKVLLLGGSASFADKNAAVGKTVGYTGYQLGGLDANHFAVFPFTGTALATITPRALAVTATGANKVYDGTTSTSVTLADQRIKGDQLSVGYGGANFVDANVGNAKVIGVAGIQLSGSDAANYSTSSIASTAANVTPAALTVTAATAQKTYGDTAALTGFTSVGLVAGETIGSVQETSAGSVPSAGVAGGPYVIIPSNAASGTFAASNYKIVYGNALLNVLPAPLLITVQNDTKMVGTFNDNNAFTVKGLVNGDTIGGFTIFNPGGPASATVAGSPYPVAFSNPTSGTYVATNYETVYVSGKLFVLPWPVAVLNAMAVWPVAYTLDIEPDMTPLITVDEELLSLPAPEE